MTLSPEDWAAWVLFGDYDYKPAEGTPLYGIFRRIVEAVDVACYDSKNKIEQMVIDMRTTSRSSIENCALQEVIDSIRNMEYK